MTEGEIFLAGFFVGALPGAVLMSRCVFRAHALRRAVELVAFSEGRANDPVFLIGSSTSGTAGFQMNPESLLRESDSPTLRQAKMALIEGAKVLRRQGTFAAAALLAGPVLGAAAGYLLAR